MIRHIAITHRQAYGLALCNLQIQLVDDVKLHKAFTRNCYHGDKGCVIQVDMMALKRGIFTNKSTFINEGLYK